MQESKSIDSTTSKSDTDTQTNSTKDISDDITSRFTNRVPNWSELIKRYRNVCKRELISREFIFSFAIFNIIFVLLPIYSYIFTIFSALIGCSYMLHIGYSDSISKFQSLHLSYYSGIVYSLILYSGVVIGSSLMGTFLSIGLITILSGMIGFVLYMYYQMGEDLR